MKADKEKPVEPVDTKDLSKYNKFYKLPCPIVRDHVFHGVIDDGDKQTIVCLQYKQSYVFHKINQRSKVEISLWELYQQNKDNVDLSPPIKKHSKKRWKLRYLFRRRVKK